MPEHLKKGKQGEQHALAYLKQQGYTILEVNWRHKHLEIDVIALDGKVLCVVEVKTRSSNAFGEPEVFVDRTKQKRLIRAINHYVQQLHCENEIRFDIVSVLDTPSGTQVHLLKDAFYALVR